jgi:hypothetical protein
MVDGPRLLVSGATKTIEKLASSEMAQAHLGHLFVPGQWTSFDRILATGLPVACDNGCFSALNRKKYINMLKRVSGSRVLWVTVPDVVGNARATQLRYRLWRPALQYFQLPIAFVAQDAQTVAEVPWGEIVCLFIGGTTSWKLGPEAAYLVREAKKRGKLVHIGRVNSAKRERMFVPLGADSFDGSQYSMFPDKHIPPALERFSTYRKECVNA